jgi:hypothetical protein
MQRLIHSHGNPGGMMTKTAGVWPTAASAVRAEMRQDTILASRRLIVKGCQARPLMPYSNAARCERQDFWDGER